MSAKRPQRQRNLTQRPGPQRFAQRCGRGAKAQRFKTKTGLSRKQPKQRPSFVFFCLVRISGVSARQILLSKILNPVLVKERLPFCDKLSAPWLILVLSGCDANGLLDLLCLSHCHDAFFLQGLSSCPKLFGLVGLCHARF
jgi:hypothetical protein